VDLPADVEVKALRAIESLETGFLPITQLQGGEGCLKLFTPMTSASSKPVRIPNLNIPLQPLKFMDFSLEQVHQAALLSDEGAVVVHIPAPARFAVHKLIVHGERGGSFRTKANKDLLQAAALIEYLAANRPDELTDAWQDALSRGPGWTKRARQGRDGLAKLKPLVAGTALLAD
jgi:hypothetical protein